MLNGILGQVLKEIQKVDIDKVVDEAKDVLQQIIKEVETAKTEVQESIAVQEQAISIVEEFVQTHPEHKDSFELEGLVHLVTSALKLEGESDKPLSDSLMTLYRDSIIIPEIVLNLVEYLREEEKKEDEKPSDVVSCNLGEFIHSPEFQAKAFLDEFFEIYPILHTPVISNHLYTLTFFTIEHESRSKTGLPLSEIIEKNPHNLIRPPYLQLYLNYLKKVESEEKQQVVEFCILEGKNSTNSHCQCEGEKDLPLRGKILNETNESLSAGKMQEQMKTETDTSEEANKREVEVLAFANALPSFEEFLALFEQAILSNEDDAITRKNSGQHSFDPFSKENTDDLESFPFFSDRGQLAEEVIKIEGIQIGRVGTSLTLNGMPFLKLVVKPMLGLSFEVHTSTKTLLNAYRNSIAEKQTRLQELNHLLASASSGEYQQEYLRKMDILTTKLQADLDAFTSIKEKIHQVKEICEKC